ncbi:MAG: hypothetical protein AAGA29_11970 [Planctomycetota bacterium]
MKIATLTALALTAATTAWAAPATMEEHIEIETSFANLDVDGNGEATLEEINTYFTQAIVDSLVDSGMPKECAEQVAAGAAAQASQEFLTAHDTNRDSVLTEDEVEE